MAELPRCCNPRRRVGKPAGIPAQSHPYSAPLCRLWNSAHPWLRELVSYEPGKPIEDVARELGLEAERDHQARLEREPARPFAQGARRDARDAGARALLSRTAAATICARPSRRSSASSASNVILGCGSNEIIEFIGKAFLNPGDEIVDRAPRVRRVQAHGHALRREHHRGARPRFRPRPRRDGSRRSRRGRSEIFIANPNNPTGTLVSQEEIDRFMDKVPRARRSSSSTRPITSSSENPPDTLKFVREGRNVVVLRTFSKIQGLANLRIGYGLAKPELIDVLQKTRQPFNANGIAQAGALAGLADDEHQRKTRELTIAGPRLPPARVRRAGARVRPELREFRPRQSRRRQGGLPGADEARDHRPRHDLLRRCPEWIRVSHRHAWSKTSASSPS